eukprot:COSAG01_NODE_1641_length_9647_cov_5.299539_16_plen_79_part_00
MSRLFLSRNIEGGHVRTGAFGSGPSRAELIAAILPHKTAQMRTKLQAIAAAARPRAVLGRSGSSGEPAVSIVGSDHTG